MSSPRTGRRVYRARAQLLTGKCVKARYVAEQHEITARHAEYELLGPPEVREIDPDARYFSPWHKPPRRCRLSYPLYEAK